MYKIDIKRSNESNESNESNKSNHFNNLLIHSDVQAKIEIIRYLSKRIEYNIKKKLLLIIFTIVKFIYLISLVL